MSKIITANNIKVKNSEILRYLGMPKDCTQPQALSMIEECKKILNESTSYKACLKTVDIKRNGAELDLGFSTESKALSRNLEGCSKAVLFCATIGASADRLIMRYSRIAPSKSVVFDATASAMIEAFCDYICAGYSGKPRFSCGFGDFGLEYQHYFLEILDTAKKIGVTLTEGNLMLPTKSVTAIIGLK